MLHFAFRARQTFGWRLTQLSQAGFHKVTVKGCNAVLCCAVLCCAVLCCAVLCCAACIVWRSKTLCTCYCIQSDFLQVWDPDALADTSIAAIQHKNRCSPYTDLHLYGKVLATFVEGQMVHNAKQGLSQNTCGKLLD